MSSYHDSFTYLGKNSAEEGFLIVSFEPDSGFKDAFLSMDQVSEDYYDGTRMFLYGTKYNTKATISITIIKTNGLDFTVEDNRRVLKWLTGARTASWLDLYQGDKFKYGFLGTVTSPQQYKLDGRVVGMSFEFASITPWAYSSVDPFHRSIQQSLSMEMDGTLAGLTEDAISISDDGVLCNGVIPGEGATFNIDDDGAIYVGDNISAFIYNPTDDLYSYIYLDMEFENETCKFLEITNDTLGETTRIDDLEPNDIIHITNKQFIIKYTTDKLTGELVNTNHVFGDSFNFVWPRLAPGDNHFTIAGGGNGHVKFSWRYPMKVGDCAMDISTYGTDIGCCDGDGMASYDTVRWEDITGIPTSLAGYGITDAYTKDEVYHKNEVYTTNEVYTRDEIDDIIENIEVPDDSDYSEVLVTVTLLASAWVAVDDMYAQKVVIDNITSQSRVNLYPDASQIAQLQDANIALTTENNYGIVTVYAIGGKPEIDYEMQASVSDIQYEGIGGGSSGGSSGGGDCSIDEDALNAMLNDILG